MGKVNIFDFFPLWVIFLCILIFFLSSVWAGVRIVRRRQSYLGKEDSSIHTIVAANLALLAFILAFTFNLTTSRFDARKSFLLQEVNAIETAWLRTDLVRGTQGADIKALLEEYLRIRIVAAENPEKIKETISRSDAIQKEIWSIVTSLIHELPRTDPVDALFVDAINEMFDIQTSRITANFTYRIPTTIWIALFVLAMFSFFSVGYLLGMAKQTNWYIILMLSLAFTAIIMVIIDLDSGKGTIQLNQQPLYDLYDRLLIKSST